jgi:hypothetical protein
MTYLVPGSIRADCRNFAPLNVGSQVTRCTFSSNATFGLLQKLNEMRRVQLRRSPTARASSPSSRPSPAQNPGPAFSFRYPMEQDDWIALWTMATVYLGCGALLLVRYLL